MLRHIAEDICATIWRDQDRKGRVAASYSKHFLANKMETHNAGLLIILKMAANGIANVAVQILEIVGLGKN